MPARRSAAVTSYTESREGKLLVKDTSKKLSVKIAFRKSNKNSQLLQQVLKMLLSKPNTLGTTAEDVYSLEFSRNLKTRVGSEFFQSTFLQPGHVPSKYELPLAFTVAVVTILWPFVQTFSKHSYSDLRN